MIDLMRICPLTGELFLDNNARPEQGQQTYLASSCSHTTSPV
ncbi:TPA: hypothetical protein ACIO89_002753 [Salmonella enterica subsp. enterica serovar Java]